MAKKVITFFLASSIKDLEYDRLAVGDFVNQLNNIYEASGVFIKLYKCESDTLDHSMRVEGSQASLDEIIKSSDMCFVIFWRKAGDVTFHELKIANEAFKKYQKPKVVVYFKKLAEGESRSDEIKEFMRIIDKEMMHYHREYEHIDSLKLGIITQLQVHGFIKADLSVEGDKIMCDNARLMSVDGIPLFAENEEYRELTERCNRAVKRCEELQNLYAADNCNLKIYRELGKAIKERDRLKADLDELTDNILKISNSIAALTTNGRVISENIKRAIKCFDEGDYDGVLSVLDPADIEKSVAELDKLESSLTAERSAVVEQYRMRILALKAQARWSEVYETYEKAVEQVINRPQMPKRIMLEYATFLFSQTHYNKCIEICAALEGQAGGDDVARKRKAEILNLCGLAYYKTGNYAVAKQRLSDSLELWRALSDENDSYKLQFAEACANLAKVYYYLDRHAEADELYNKALNIYAAAEQNDGIRIKAVDIYMSLADLYYQVNRHRDAEELFKKALGLCEELADDIPPYGQYEADLCDRLAHIDLAILAHRSADRYFVQALKTRSALICGDGNAFYDYLKRVCNALAEQYLKNGYVEYAEKIKKCVKPLSDNTDCIAETDFAYYDKTIDLVQIEKLCRQALYIRRGLVRQNPEAHEREVAQSYKNIAELYIQTGNLDNARNCLEESLKIHERLLSFNAGNATADIAATKCMFALLYSQASKFGDAEAMYKSAIKTYSSLSFKNELARTYNHLGRLYIKFGKTEKAVKALYNSMLLYVELYRKSPGAYIDRVINTLADALYSLCPQEEKAVMSGLLL